MGFFSRRSDQYDKDGTERLRNATPQDTELIRSLLAHGADPNAPKKDGQSAPLIIAASAGCVATMDTLIQHGADPNLFSGTKWHETPLLAAIYENQLDAVKYLIQHGANIDGSLRSGSPLNVAFLAKNIAMLECLLDHGADPNKKLMGILSPARACESVLRCMKHDIRKMPKEGCVKCADRLLLIRMLSLLRQHGGRPLVAGSSNGTGLLDAYVDLIAHVEKWEQRGEKWAEELGNITYNDPLVRSMMEWMIKGGLGEIGVPVPVDSIVDMPDLSGEGFERIETTHWDHSRKYSAATDSYKCQLR
ncbi:ankyrin [Rhypophila sp. PSN 637]